MTIKTTAGPLTLERPKLRGTDQRFASQLLGAQVTQTNTLEALVIAGFDLGLSTRDVEATPAEALGAQAALSRSTVSRICSQLAEEFTAWQAKGLADVELDYLYLDGTCLRYHPAPGPSRCWSPTGPPPPAADLPYLALPLLPWVMRAVSVVAGTGRRR